METDRRPVKEKPAGEGIHPRKRKSQETPAKKSLTEKRGCGNEASGRRDGEGRDQMRTNAFEHLIGGG
jgi:hypothetical protein